MSLTTLTRRLVMAIAGTVLLIGLPARGEDRPFKPEASVAEGGGVIGRATLTLRTPRVGPGATAAADLRFEYVGGGGSVFNPFFSMHWPYPGELAVYDAGKKYLVDCLPVPRSEMPAGAGSHVRLGGEGDAVSCVLKFRVASRDGRDLPPGKYYLQVIYYRAFTSFQPPDRTHAAPGGLAHAYDGFDRSELFRSNVVEIELLPAPATQPAN